jgi:uncharacterized protein (DUF302 family)
METRSCKSTAEKAQARMALLYRAVGGRPRRSCGAPTDLPEHPTPAFAVVVFEVSAVPDNGLVTLQSSHDFATTLERLTAALEAKGVRVFARIDHAAGAASVGLALRPTTLVVFGNPAAGTPLMQAAQTVGIDLPLKALVWQDAQGAAHLTYNDPAWIAARHGLDGGADQAVMAIAAGLAAFARHATGP